MKINIRSDERDGAFHNSKVIKISFTTFYLLKVWHAKPDGELSRFVFGVGKTKDEAIDSMKLQFEGFQRYKQSECIDLIAAAFPKGETLTGHFRFEFIEVSE